MRPAEIKTLYLHLKPEIERRLDDFRRIRERGDEREMFAEMLFCTLTPQSKAKVCWKAVECLLDGSIYGSERKITECLVGVRFKYTKARRIMALRERFPEGKGIKDIMDSFEGPHAAREWVVKNIDGYGYKEASHFLRNTGYGLELAILDRHILRNLVSAGAIDVMPSSLTRRKYMEIEEKMRNFSEKTEIPMPALDLIFWYEGAGEIFK